MPITTSGRRLLAPMRTRAPCVVQRISQVWPDVAQADVVGRVEARLGAEVAGRERAERLLDLASRASARPGNLPAGRGTRYPEVACTAPCARFASTTPNPRSVRPLEPRDPGKVGIYACGPTVYARVHVGNARPFVVFSQLKRFLEHEGYEATLVANITDINDKIYDAARAAGRPSAELARGDGRATTSTTPTGSGSGGPDHEPLATEYVEAIIDLIARAGRAAGTPTRPAATSTSACARWTATASSRAATSTRWTRARASRAPIARRTRSTSRSGRRTRRARTPPGTRRGARGRPGLAHRVLGDGRGAAGRRLRHPRRRHRPRLPAPRERGGADAGRRAASRWRGCGCTTACSSSPTRRCPSRSATSAGWARCSTQVGGEVLVLYFSGGHYRQPIAFSRRAPGGGRARGGADPRGGRRLVAGRVAGGAGAATATRSSTRCADDFNTARGAGGAVRLDPRGQPLATARSATAHLREMLDVLGLDALLDRPRTARPPRRSSWPSAREAARAATATGPRPTACATSCARWAGRSATARTDRSSSRRPDGGGRAARRRHGRKPRGGRPRRAAARRRTRRRAARPRRRAARSAAPPSRRPRPPDVVYGRNAVREALRGRRRVRRIWATEATAKEGFAGARVDVVAAEEIDGPLRDRTPTRACARRSTRTRTPTPPSCSRAPDPLLVALDEVTDPQNLGAIVPHGRVRGRDRRRHPRAALGRGHGARSARRRRGRSSTCRSRACATSPTSSPRPRRRAAGSTARRPARARRYDAPGLHGRGRRWCSARRARGCARGSPSTCDDLVSLPLRGRIESLNVSATAAVLLYAILQQRLDAST